MDTLSILSGRTFFGYTVKDIATEDNYGRVYNAEKTGVDGRRHFATIRHMVVPSDAHYNSVVAAFNNDTASADRHFTSLINDFYRDMKVIQDVSAANGKNIVQIFDYNITKRTSGHQYDVVILTEKLLEFDRFIQMNGLKVRDALRLGKDVLSALIAADKSYIKLHGDIKESNLFVTGTGDFKLGNFVVSKAFKGDEKSTEMIGTPVCSAPEMLKGEEVDGRADIFSLGMMLYKLFNNQRIPFLPEFPAGFTSSDMQNAISKRINCEVPAMPALATDEIGKVILKALAAKGERYGTAVEFYEALSAAEKLLSDAELDKVLVRNGMPQMQYAANDKTAAFYTPKSTAEEKTAPLYNRQEKTTPLMGYARQQSRSTADSTANFNQHGATDNMTSTQSNGYTYPQKSNEKKNNNKLIAIIAIAIAAALLIGGGIFAFVSLVLSSDDVSLNSYDITLDENTSYFQLKVISDDVDFNDLGFRSTDITVATVDNEGLIYAVGEGSAIIEVYNLNNEEGTLASANVNVTSIAVAEKISADEIYRILSADTHGATFGVYVKDVTENQDYIFDNSHMSMGSSALVSIPVLYTMGQQMDGGSMNFSTPVNFQYTYNGRGIYKQVDNGRNIAAGDLASSMLKYSDNNCINSLMNYLSISEIQSTMNENGMTGTNIVRTLALSPSDSRENKISAYDAGEMFYQMITDRVSPGKDFLMDNFRIVDSMSRYGMGKYIPEGVTFLNHNAVTSNKYNEIIYVESGDMKFIVVFISNGGNPENSAQISANLASYVYNSFSSY